MNKNFNLNIVKENDNWKVEISIIIEPYTFQTIANGNSVREAVINGIQKLSSNTVSTQVLPELDEAIRDLESIL